MLPEVLSTQAPRELMAPRPRDSLTTAFARIPGLDDFSRRRIEILLGLLYDDLHGNSLVEGLALGLDSRGPMPKGVLVISSGGNAHDRHDIQDALRDMREGGVELKCISQNGQALGEVFGRIFPGVTPVLSVTDGLQ